MSAAVDIAEPVATDWPITNCYIDAWTNVLRHWGLEPLAGLGVTAAQDYEGDQFTFFKYTHDDLELLYGVSVGELSVYRPLQEQIDEQIRLGRLVLMEADGYYLPDTRATSYQALHTKTTIAIDRIDLPNGRLWYHHNTGYYELSGADYAGVFRTIAGALPPYIEFAKRRFAPLAGTILTEAALHLLRRHVRRRPRDNPISRYRQDFPRHMEWLLARPESFHDYAFNIFRQLGANHELLARHVDWLTVDGPTHMALAAEAARAISATTKALQFKVARIASRRRFDPCEAMFDTLERNYDAMIDALERSMA